MTKIMLFRYCIGLLTCLAVLPISSADSRPNIVIIIADDLGWADIGYNNPNVYSPNLDELASKSAVFTKHYVMPQCTPTRVALMTGRYPGRFGGSALEASNENAFPLDTPTIASMLQKTGYATYLAGKWHLGSVAEHGPNHFGFDSSYGSFAGAVGMYDHRYRTGEFEHTWHRDHSLIEGAENGIHATDLITGEAIRIIKQQRDKPFFLYLPFHSVHTPLDERGQFTHQPTTLDPNQPSRWLNEDRISWFNDPEGKIQKEEDHEKRLLLAAVHHFDDAVGNIVDSLDQSGQRQNTLILFSSDNGPQGSWPGNAYPDDLKLTDFNQPLPMKGKKLDVWEGGIHVPGLANWPGRIGPRIVDIPVHIVDWFPTLASLVEPNPIPNIEYDGVDLSGLLFSDEELQERDLYWTWNSRTNRWAVRLGDWKIVKYGTGQPEAATDWKLFKLKNDPKEARDLSKTNPDITDALHKRFLIHRAKDRQ